MNGGGSACDENVYGRDRGVRAKERKSERAKTNDDGDVYHDDQD